LETLVVNENWFDCGYEACDGCILLGFDEVFEMHEVFFWFLRVGLLYSQVLWIFFYGIVEAKLFVSFYLGPY